MIEYDKIKWDLLEEDSVLNDFYAPKNIREWVSFINQYMRLHIFSNNISRYDPTYYGIQQSDIDNLILRTLGTRFTHNAISTFRHANKPQFDNWFNNGIKWYPIQKTSEFFDRVSFCSLRDTELESFDEIEIPKHLAGNLDIRGSKIHQILGAPLYIGGTIICCEKTYDQAQQINTCGTTIHIDTDYY